MIDARRAAWRLGAPVRWFLLRVVGAYRVLLSPVMGGACRFHPSCSVYAEGAIRNVGAARGVALAAWRILRCSPLSRGGVEYPPPPPAWRATPSRPSYEAITHVRAVPPEVA